MKDGLQQQDLWVSGLTADSTVETLATITTAAVTAGSATQLNVTSGTHVDNVLIGAGSPYGHGIVFRSTFNAEAIISGGMWVVGSEGVLKPAAASTQYPLGVAIGNVASGAACDVLVRGPRYMIAEGTVAAGTSFMMGAGGGLNCVVAAAAGSSHLGTVLIGASSGTTAKALVMLAL